MVNLRVFYGKLDKFKLIGIRIDRDCVSWLFLFLVIFKVIKTHNQGELKISFYAFLYFMFAIFQTKVRQRNLPLSNLL